MPGRIGHAAITLGLAPLVAGVCLLAGLPAQYAALAGGGVLATLPLRFKLSLSKLSRGRYVHIYFNPDMDIAGGESKISEALGIEMYRQQIVHRSGLRARDWYYALRQPWRLLFFSHLPFIGTLPRFALLVLFLTLPVLLFSLEKYVTFPALFFLWLGMSLSDSGHTLADLIFSWLKKG